ncbi:DUF4177 domain-containing protein [Glycomyces buryatensis]|uniref:DUF4177 domain-containing protein n=1 Tax=Glycomyces buryatensis TaxID=2570927 RepID=A0A4S8QM12_9ACTN|nr:DUF4177 domain-containing protein [Glycomyces buryatensis]THV41774.1 DUF4177 domain-containing protein [Glycomyces buryatensis]
MGTRYEYKTIKVPMAAGNSRERRKRDKILNDYAAQGWEVDQIDPKSILAFGRSDRVTLRRKLHRLSRAESRAESSGQQRTTATNNHR